MRIGVFDSGVGGITVLTELRKAIPAAEYIYLGDTANLPYGAKSPAQVRQLSARCARQLKKKKIDALVVACNTASSLALDQIREEMGAVPVIGVVEPGVEAALKAREESGVTGPILVLATRATVKSGAYGGYLREVLSPEKVVEQACPLLVPLIEEGWTDHPVLHQTIAEYVGAHLKKFKSPGVALLGCTHYPWIHAAFEKAMPGWNVVNSAQAVVRVLERRGIVGKATEPGEESPAVQWIFSDPDALPEFAKRLVQE